MTGPLIDPTRDREEVARATEALVSGWTIPEVIPQGICTAVVPGTECLDGVRLLARTLHTVVLRARPRTLVLVCSSSIEVPRIRAVGGLSTSLGDTPIDERLAARIASFWPGDLDIIPEGEDEDSLPELHRIAPLIAHVLIPGCRIVPIEIPDMHSTTFDPIGVGQELGRQLNTDVGCSLIASCTLLPRKDRSSPASDEISGDASILKYLLDPAAADLASAVSENPRISGGTPMVLATSHAVERGRQRGFLLEHSVVESNDQLFGSAAVVL